LSFMLSGHEYILEKDDSNMRALDLARYGTGSV
jgi:hypothetical protein